MDTTNLTDSNVQFAICVSGDEDGDLEVWKLYRILSDPKAKAVGCLRVVDESGEDYLYPQRQFVIMELSVDIQKQLLAAVQE